MGDIADYYSDMWMDSMFEESAKRALNHERAKEIKDEYLAGILIWYSKDESEHPVIQMTDNHIVNCIKMLKRGANFGDNELSLQWVQIFEWELKKRQQNANSITDTTQNP